jgi:hypothetical protein
LASDVATYNGASPTLTTPVVNGGTFNGSFSVSSSAVFGTTLSAKIGFFGAPGTSAATTILALATTVTATGSGVGFQSTAAVASILTGINAITQALKDAGFVKTG